MPLMSAWAARDKGGMPLHTVGNAMVLHARDQISAQAQALAMSVAQDPEHDVVVLDVPGRMSALTWESVAAALPRRRRTGIRLVICGDDAEPTSLVGQWLSERLSRAVVAPHGKVTRAAAGALFVHAGTGTGWIRYRPGREPQWEGKRFPRPEWDALAAEALATSSTGVAEPVPGGVWIHDSTDEAAVEPHREWLLSNVPCQPGIMVVLLGCPGTRKLPLDDVNRFWRRLTDDDRRRVRFARFGPVDVPGRDPVGQAVADALSSPVVCYTGVPVGPPSQPQLFTVDEDGRLCWQSFAEELVYSPRERPAAPAPAPRMIRHRIPIELGEELGSGVYWYAEDTVVEVVQSGLWVRPSEVPRDADQIRAVLADAEKPALVFDDSHGPRANRMRTVAADVAAQLDPATRERTELVAASVVVAAAGRGQSPAVGRLSEGAVESAAVPDFAAERAEAAWEPPAVAPAAVVPAEVAAPVSPAAAIPAPTGPAIPAPGYQEQVSHQEPLAPRHQPAFAQEPAHSEQPAHIEQPAHGEQIAYPQQPVYSEQPVPAEQPVGWAQTPSTPSFEAPPFHSDARAEAPPGAEIVEPGPPAAPPLPLAPPPATAPAGMTSQADYPLPAGTAPTTPPATEPEPEPATTRTPAERPRPAAPDRARLQPVPERSASAQPVPGRGLAEERAWLRRSLSKEYDQVASTVSRVLSQHPGLQGGNGLSRDDALTDSVAVRLYLSGRGSAIDAALRTARKGPHVPFARCTVSGLTRLPSHRGATAFIASPTEDQWTLLAGRTMLTEWGFLNTLSEPSKDLEGDTDVLLWSMTGRRTALLEPDDDDYADNRVLFLPGTSFKILERREPAGNQRGRLLLREVGANEISPDGRVRDSRASFDELATTSLTRYAERWADAEPQCTVGPAARLRIRAVPGLAEQTEEKR